MEITTASETFDKPTFEEKYTMLFNTLAVYLAQRRINGVTMNSMVKNYRDLTEKEHAGMPFQVIGEYEERLERIEKELRYQASFNEFLDKIIDEARGVLSAHNITTLETPMLRYENNKFELKEA